MGRDVARRQEHHLRRFAWRRMWAAQVVLASCDLGKWVQRKVARLVGACDNAQTEGQSVEEVRGWVMARGGGSSLGIWGDGHRNSDPGRLGEGHGHSSEQVIEDSPWEIRILGHLLAVQ